MNDNDREMETLRAECETLKAECESLKERTFKQSYWFSLGIIIGLGVLIIAYLIIQRKDCYNTIVVYVGFAATLLSIVLSVFAIMFTYTTNNQIGERFKDINNAASEIRHTAEMIRREANTMNSRIDGIQRQVNMLAQGQVRSSEENESDPSYSENNKPRP